MSKIKILGVCIFSFALSSLIGCDGRHIEYEIIEIVDDFTKKSELTHSYFNQNEPLEITQNNAIEETQETQETYENENTITEEPENVQEEVIQEPENVHEEVIQEPENVQEEIIQEPENVQEEVIQESENVQEEIVITTQSEVQIEQVGNTIVQRSEAVTNEYFQDALFIGDSILKGFKAFVSPYPDNVIAEQNAGLDQIMYNKNVYYTSPTVQTTLWNAIDQSLSNPEKIYVLIGVNGVPGLDTEQSMYYYQDLIVKLKERFPNKLMYFCALTPLTQELSDRRAPSFCTSKIEDFNKQLLGLCEYYNVYFLQTDENLKDEYGYLLPDYDAGDGMHLNKNGHTVLLEYFKTHIVSPFEEELEQEAIENLG